MRTNSTVKTLSGMVFMATFLVSMFLGHGGAAANVTGASPQVEWTLDAELPAPEATAADDFRLQSRDSADYLVSKLTAEGVNAQLTAMSPSALGGL